MVLFIILLAFLNRTLRPTYIYILIKVMAGNVRKKSSVEDRLMREKVELWSRLYQMHKEISRLVKLSLFMTGLSI
jgi:hypothetical protein